MMLMKRSLPYSPLVGSEICINLTLHCLTGSCYSLWSSEKDFKILIFFLYSCSSSRFLLSYFTWALSSSQHTVFWVDRTETDICNVGGGRGVWKGHQVAPGIWKTTFKKKVILVPHIHSCCSYIVSFPLTSLILESFLQVYAGKPSIQHSWALKRGWGCCESVWAYWWR